MLAGDSWDLKATTGDLKNWVPGGSKQEGQGLGDADWPGKAAGGSGDKPGKKARKKNAAP